MITGRGFVLISSGVGMFLLGLLGWSWLHGPPAPVLDAMAHSSFWRLSFQIPCPWGVSKHPCSLASWFYEPVQRDLVSHCALLPWVMPPPLAVKTWGYKHILYFPPEEEVFSHHLPSRPFWSGHNQPSSSPSPACMHFCLTIC